jgi:hypothetical protein
MGQVKKGANTMLANGTRIIHDVSGAGTCQESEKGDEVLVTFDNGTTSVVKLSALKFAPKYKVVFANGEECYPRATDLRDAKRAARALQSAQGRPVGHVPVVHCEPCGTEVRRIGEGRGGTVHTLLVPPIITPEQKAWIDHRRSEQRVAGAFQVKVFSGDGYGRSSLGQVTACDPDGNIRQNETWPTRGVPLEDAEASARSA